MSKRVPRQPKGPSAPKPREPPEPGRKKYDTAEIEKLWRELCADQAANRLPEPGACPGHTRPRADGFDEPEQIKRLREALLDDKLGLGMQLRWSLASLTLRGVAIATGEYRGGDAWADLCKECRINATTLNQLGGMGGDDPSVGAKALHRKTCSQQNLEALCARLNAVHRPAYRRVGRHHRLTPSLFQAPCRGDEAVADFMRLVLQGHLSPAGQAYCMLMQERKKYYDTDERKPVVRELVKQLARTNDCRPIQCITARGAQTAVEALAWHLADTLPGKLQDTQAPRRDIFLVPCGRWVHPSGCRGLEYLVRHLVALLRDGRVSDTQSDMSEDQLQREIDWLRQHLGQRSAILIFVGHDAIGSPLPRLNDAIADAPLSSLLSHLSRPALGTHDDPYEPHRFEWSYFVVIGTAEPANLDEYKQRTLALPAINVGCYPMILEEAKYLHADEMNEGMRDRVEPATESVLCLFEQVRRIETIRIAEGSLDVASDFSKLPGLGPLAQRFIDVLDDPRRRTVRAFVLLTAFAIGGIKRATLIRCLMLWRAFLPDPQLEPERDMMDGWSGFFETWLDCFRPVIRSGPDERWREIDPPLHPFEYSGTVLLNLTGDKTDWWDQSIDFLIAEVRDAIVARVQKTEPALAAGIHRILAEESLRQHTMVLRHTSHADRLTMRSHRRGLQALYHGLSSLPPTFDAQSGDPAIDPGLNLDVNLPAQHMRRFIYLYCGLFPSLLRDDTLGNFSAAWGADILKLEIALFADQLLFRRISPQALAAIRAGTQADGSAFAGAVSAAMIDTHTRNLAAAAVRAGPHPGWSGINERLERFVDAEHDAGACVALPGKVLLHMSLVARGPEDEDTLTRFDTLAQRLTVDVEEFLSPAWRLPGEPTLDFPTPAYLHAMVERQCAALGAKPAPVKSEVGTLLFIRGMMRADAAEASLDDKPREADQVRRSLSHLLKCFAMLSVARRLMWDGYGDEECPLPYLAAEGLRTLCRVGLELMRVMRRNPKASDADALVPVITARVRQSLDEYTRVFHTNEGERTQMLILESRFARLAYNADPAWAAAKDVRDILVQPYQEQWPALVESSRYERALKFLGEAEACLLTFAATDSLRIRLLSERCSTLRYLAINLVRNAHSNPALADRAAVLERAAAACALGRLDVVQMKNIVARLALSRSVWLASETKAKWSATAEYHDQALRNVDSALATMRKQMAGATANA